MATYVNPGLDASGNGNNWTVNNINWTSPGTTYDIMTDVPTLTSATASNFAVLNPIASGDYFASGQTLITSTGANLNYGTGGRNAFGTIAVSSGKFYWEMSNTSNTASAVTLFGLVTVAARASVYGVYYNSSNGYKGLGTLNSGASETAYGATWTDNDVIGVALDMDVATPTVTFYKNNTSQGAISVSSFVGQSVMMWIQNGANSGNMSGWVNFGQRPFAYTPPTGFVALNTFNLPTPTIGATASTQANKYFDISLYTGTGSAQTITNSGGMQPDFVWIKRRSTSGSHLLIDAVRGSNKLLYSNLTDAEDTNANALTSFNSGGFSVGSDTNANQNGTTIVGWQWRASNAAGVSNTAGSITSTVSANTSSGFSVVTYTGNAATSATIGHGLGVAPDMLVVKNRQAATTSTNDWNFYFRVLGTGYLISPSTNGYNSGTNRWNGTNPTSTVFSVGGDSAKCNNEAINYVAYCFAAVSGYSAFGTYTGNGSTDGPFLYTGFRPKYVMVKRYDATGGDWVIQDGVRSPYNASISRLWIDLANAETDASNYAIDLVSNGFKMRNTNTDSNASGGTYVYMAFAENPFKYANAR